MKKVIDKIKKNDNLCRGIDASTVGPSIKIPERMRNRQKFTLEIKCKLHQYLGNSVEYCIVSYFYV